MNRLFIAPAAERDLQAILEYIARDRAHTARATIARIKATMALLATQPLMGQRRPGFPEDQRSFPTVRWVIFYRVVDDGIEVHRVIDGARDIDNLFG